MEEERRGGDDGMGWVKGRLAVVEVAGAMNVGSMELLWRQVLARPLEMNAVLVDGVKLIPPWNDEGVEDGSGIIAREGGVDTRNEGGESDEEVKRPHFASPDVHTPRFCTSSQMSRA